jgi:adenylate cyclase
LHRKLTTILAADVEGYTRLMRTDEEATLRTLGEYREAMDALIDRHGGRVFSTGGDSVLAEFGSAVEAVRCAIAFQEEMAKRNAALADDRKLLFRIGINVGDVIVKDDDLLGDGVNVAARLEGLARAGGICISGSTFDQVKHKLPQDFQDLGPQEVKNIAEPVSAYSLVPGSASTTAPAKTRGAARRWRMSTIAAAAIAILAAGIVAWWQPWLERNEPAAVERMAFALPEKPSVAVLPFDNLTGQADQEIMIDGLVEDIITTLSAIPGLFVIARNSTFTYKGRAVKVGRVAEELGVRYVLEGSVQSSGGNARITAQLIDAIAGNHLWAKRYDRELKNIFAVQDEISWEIATALEVELVAGEQAREQRATTSNSEAYALLRQGRKFFAENFSENALKARRLYERALELDPRFVAAMVETARTYLGLGRGMSEPNRSEAIAQGERYLERARAIDESYAGIYEVSGQLLNLRGEFHQARRMLEKAVEIEPSNTEYLRRLAKSLGDRGEPEKAIPLMKEAMRLNPYYNRTYPRYLSVAYRRAGRLDEALEVALRLLEYRPVYVAAHRELAVTYAMMGNMDKAREHARTLLKLKPDFTVQRWARSINEHIPEYRERDLDALRAAGIPKGE